MVFGKKEGKNGLCQKFSQSFLLYRGNQISSTVFSQWESSVGKEFRFPQPTPVTFSLLSALKNSFRPHEKMKISVNKNSSRLSGYSDASAGAAGRGSKLSGRDSQIGTRKSPESSLKAENHADNEPQLPVLFVMVMANWNGISGFRVSDDYYSPYPGEKEIILKEHSQFKVLKI